MPYFLVKLQFDRVFENLPVSEFVMAGDDPPPSNEGNLGYLSHNEKIKDYVLLFVLTFLLTRYLTLTAIGVMFLSVFGFHLLHNLTYHEEPRPGFNSLHVKYFLGTYLLCVLYLQLSRMWKDGEIVRCARLRGRESRYDPGGELSAAEREAAAAEAAAAANAGAAPAGSSPVISPAGSAASGGVGSAAMSANVVPVGGGPVVRSETKREHVRMHEVKQGRA